jgi:hypothetical protein
MDRVGIAVRKPILRIMRRFYPLTGIHDGILGPVFSVSGLSFEAAPS